MLEAMDEDKITWLYNLKLYRRRIHIKVLHICGIHPSNSSIILTCNLLWCLKLVMCKMGKEIVTTVQSHLFHSSHVAYEDHVKPVFF